MYTKIAELYWLGTILAETIRISGWLLHEMYKLTTDTGDYAIKVLNPEIMKRPEAYRNFIESERIAALNAEAWVPLVPALLCEGLPLVKIDDRFVMVFPWVEGRSLTTAPAGIEACHQIGKVFSQIHAAGRQNQSSSRYDVMKIDTMWLALLEDRCAGISQMILNLKDRYNESLSVLNQDLVYSHCDVDQKNVLWDSGGNPIIIDWEAASLINPYVEILTAALYWSGIVDGFLDQYSFQSVLRWYVEVNNQWHKLQKIEYLYGCIGFIEWLMYNVSRLDSANPDEVQLANIEIEKTVRLIRLFHERFDEIREWINFNIV